MTTIWLAGLGAIAVIAIVFIFLFLYLKGFWQVKQRYRVQSFPAIDAENFTLTLASFADAFILRGEIDGFWIEADAIFSARLNAIQNAKSSIQFETYFMTPGNRADDFALALIAKAQQGVQIQVLVDEYGTHKIPQKYWQRLQAEGVKVRCFNPFNWRHPFAYLQRNHRKTLLIDGQLALIGGAGVSDLWDGKAYHSPWLDYEVRVKGAVISRLQGLFLQHWLDAGGVVDLSETPIALQTGGEAHISIASGEEPSFRNSSIRSLYQSLIQAARDRIWIASPYFLPSFNTCENLIAACDRGVEVRILTMGEKSDKPFIHHAAREMYGKLLKKGVKIYEYQPSMMHAKILLIDDRWVSWGSANFDPRSFFQNDELNLTVDHKALTQNFLELFDRGFANAQLISEQLWRDRSFRERIIGRFWLLFFNQL
jgi:cardiolipin synthase